MKQLLLEFDAQQIPTLDTFVTGQNAELTQLLSWFASGKTSFYGERSVYFWGEVGAGKSHLLRALANHPAARYIPPFAHESAFDFSPEIQLYLLDDCQLLPALQQIAAFNLFNETRAHQAFFVAAGDRPPMILNVRDDLRTRLGWGLIYQLHGLSDEEKINALEIQAQLKGIQIAPGVLPYLITHYQRDMSSLSAMLGRLDQYSLETKRPITLPLLRELMLQTI